MPRYPLPLLTLLLCLTFTAHAQIILDGTLGKSGALAGPNYQIGADLGQQHGGNLFHSFGDFNLQSHESATFSGPANVQNVISRVTGGNPSSIDGTLRSTIPNADMYFLNPYGVMFGPNAKLDVQGGFHVSTADYLRLQDGGRFEARTPGNSLLTVAPVTAFGFLTEEMGEIRLQDSKLSVSEGRTLSLIGGNIHIDGEPPVYDAEGIPTYSSDLYQYGRINLASIASRGEITPTDVGLNLSAAAQGGQITVNNTRIASQDGGGIFIRGGRFEAANTVIGSLTHSDKNSGVVNIQVDNMTLTNGTSLSNFTTGVGRAGNIEIEAGQITLRDGTILSFTVGTGESGNIILKVAGTLILTGKTNDGNGSSIKSVGAEDNIGKRGNIEIKANQIELKDGARISTQSGGNISIKVVGSLNLSGEGKLGGSAIWIDLVENANNAAGRIEIEARQINLMDGALIDNSTPSKNDSGTIILKVGESLTISGISNKLGISSGISSDSLSEEINAGNAGRIEIESPQISLTNRANISSSTIGSGNAGSISIKADTLTIHGEKINDLTGIFSVSTSTQSNPGKAGEIKIEARQITLEKASIDASGNAEGGSIIIKGADTLTALESDIATATVAENSKQPGKIEIESRQITLAEGAKISGITRSKEGGNIVLQVADTLTVSGENTEGGDVSSIWSNGGHIRIEAGQIILKNGAQIDSSQSYGTGEIGSIVIKSGTLTLSGKNKKGDSSSILSHSTNTDTNAGKGGNIEIESHQINLMDEAQIASSTVTARNGGNITILADTLTISGGDKPAELNSGIYSNSVSKDANSQKGNGGNITIGAVQIVLTAGGGISSSTYSNGEAGTITIIADTLVASGESKSGYSSHISTNSEGAFGNGKSGDIKIGARQIILTDGAIISSSTRSSGAGGTIAIVSDTLTISGENQSSGQSSGVSAHTDNAGSENSAILCNSLGKDSNSGNAGKIEIQANTINITDNSRISTSAFNNATGGDITIITPNLLYLREGSISTLVEGNNSNGDGGNITIQTPVFVVLDGASIMSGAKGGSGGNININSKHFLASSGRFLANVKPGTNQSITMVSIDRRNFLDASSDNLEKSGKIRISTTPNNLGATLTILPATLQNYEIIKKHCTVEQLLDKEKRNSFVPTGRGGVSETPTDLRAGSVRDVMGEQLW